MSFINKYSNFAIFTITIFLINIFSPFQLIKSVNALSQCNLKISDNELSSFRGGSNLIFNDGVVNEQWMKGNTFSTHIASDKEIEYLYAMETHLKENTKEHKKIVSVVIYAYTDC